MITIKWENYKLINEIKKWRYETERKTDSFFLSVSFRNQNYKKKNQKAKNKDEKRINQMSKERKIDQNGKEENARLLKM